MQIDNTTPERISSILPSTCPNSPGLFAGLVTGCRKPVKCHQWKCEFCRWPLFYAFEKRARSIPYDWMITLTSPDGLLADAIKKLNAQAREFRRLFRKCIGPIEHWTWVNESGPRGNKLHKHMLLAGCNRRIPYRIMHRLANRAGLPRWRHFKRVQGDVAGYATKYLTKDLCSGAWPRYSRRCMTTFPAPLRCPGFEPLRFISIDSVETKEVMNEVTGEVFSVYAGPSYVPMDAALPPEFFAKLPAGWSVLPHLGSQREPTTEWSQMVTDCDAGTAQPIPSPNCSFLYLSAKRNSVENKEAVS